MTIIPSFLPQSFQLSQAAQACLGNQSGWMRNQKSILSIKVRTFSWGCLSYSLFWVYWGSFIDNWGSLNIADSLRGVSLLQVLHGAAFYHDKLEEPSQDKSFAWGSEGQNWKLCSSSLRKFSWKELATEEKRTPFLAIDKLFECKLEYWFHYEFDTLNLKSSWI